MIGIVVDGVSDVMSLQENQIGDVSSLVTNIDTKYIVDFAAVESKMIIIVDIEHL